VRFPGSENPELEHPGGAAGGDSAGSAEAQAQPHGPLQRDYSGADAGDGVVRKKNLVQGQPCGYL
jgi:hypothetical protein